MKRIQSKNWAWNPLKPRLQEIDPEPKNTVFFEDTSFEEIRCEESVFENCSIGDRKEKNIIFVTVMFRQVTLSRTQFREVTLSDADFQGADLRNCAFRNCDLRQTQFSHARLEGLDIRDSKIEGINVAPDNLRNVIVDVLQASYLSGLMGLIIK